MNRNFLKILFYVICIFSILIVGGLYAADYFGWVNIFHKNIKKIVVSGNSMYPYYQNGQELKADFSYTGNSKNLAREDVIVADFQNSLKEYLLKFIKVAPGDKFHIDENTRILYINEEPMKNSQGETYILTEQNVRMLQLYERDLSGVMPNGIYFIFGDGAGTMDSGRFGPITRKYIMAKVLN